MPPSSASSAGPDPSVDETPPPEVSSFPFAAPRQQDALKQLSSVLTRRLGTLTSTISGYADLLVDTQGNQEQRELAMKVLEATDQIDDLLADLRHYSRSMEPAFRPVSAPEVARSAVRLLSTHDRERICQKVEPPADREIEADPRLLRQALLNLLQNALEATDATTDVLLRVAGDDPKAPDPAVAFEVWNDGEIDLDAPRALFQPFYTTRPQRLGLGLPIAAHIAAEHDGTVRLATNSVAEGGTCFTLRI